MFIVEIGVEVNWSKYEKLKEFLRVAGIAYYVEPSCYQTLDELEADCKGK